MRICFDGRGLAGKLTGAGKALSFLLRQLRQDFPQHDYVVVAPSNHSDWRLPRQLFWEQIQFPVRVTRERADILHAPGGTSAPLIRYGKSVMTVHDIAPTRHPEFLPHARSRWYWGRWVPFTAKFADAILVPSAATKRDLVECIGVPEHKIHVTPLGLALDLTEPVTPTRVEKVRSTYRLPVSYLLYVGTIDRRKDYATLLRALNYLDKDIFLVVAGTVIKGRTDFPQLVEQLGLQERVAVLGYVPDRDLPVLYREALAFVYPTFYEGFGLPVLEAMACGTPVITYNVTSLPEVAGDAGILLDLPVSPEILAEHVTRIRRDGALRQHHVELGLEQAKHFEWKTTARLTVQAYESLLGRF
jgi:glycosyltransferase involved in cell wall biosynthesis